MLAFTTLKSFLYLKFFEDFDLHLALTRIRKNDLHDLLFVSPPLFFFKPSAVDPFTLPLSFAYIILVHHPSLSLRSRILACSQIFSLSLSLSFVIFFLSHRLIQFLLDIWYKRILRLENCLSTRRYRRSV